MEFKRFIQGLRGALGVIVASLLFAVPPVWAGRYTLVTGEGVDVCEAYRRNFELFDDSKPMACERQYDPKIKEFSSPPWRKLDLKKHFELYKKAEIYLQKGWKGATKEDILDGIELRAEHQKIELYIAHVDIDGDGNLVNVLAVCDFLCGPNPKMTEEFRKTRLYLLNKKLTDFDYPRQRSWGSLYNNATLKIYSGKPYVESYVPNDGWGNLFTKSGKFFVFREVSLNQMKLDGGRSRVKTVCEFDYVPDSIDAK
jgi:hypothetical protein